MVGGLLLIGSMFGAAAVSAAAAGIATGTATGAGGAATNIIRGSIDNAREALRYDHDKQDVLFVHFKVL